MNGDKSVVIKEEKVPHSRGSLTAGHQRQKPIRCAGIKASKLGKYQRCNPKLQSRVLSQFDSWVLCGDSFACVLPPISSRSCACVRSSDCFSTKAMALTTFEPPRAGLPFTSLRDSASHHISISTGILQNERERAGRRSHPKLSWVRHRPSHGSRIE